jgi:Tol biopolymer transport system component
MSSSIGGSVGSYTIIREVGRGGMGVVYLARDTRLDRDVAIKALPEDMAADSVRLERFEREARTLAQLSHPNLAGIYGVEEQDGARYLILEYVEGETIADLLDRGALSVDDALEYAVQIAAGVEAAHEAGVIHRDLKPANIKITPEGKAKVLDFGLARAEESSTSSSSIGLSNSPTLTSPVHYPANSPTIPGAILGTAPYMSPEQARGRKVDKRTDIWSFAVVLYEMLTGVGPFHGETATDSIGAILHRDVDLGVLPKKMPGSVRRLISRGLVRDKEHRLQAIGDARIELEEALARVQAGDYTDELTADARRMAWLWPSLAGVFALALLAAIFTPRTAPQTTAASMAPRIVDVQQVTDHQANEGHPALSPDAKHIAYAAIDGTDSDIYVLRVGGENPINVTAHADSHDFDPAWSPDGERIAFASRREGGGIFVMGATGENPIRVSDEGYNPAWSPDGKSIVYTTEFVQDPYGRTGIGALYVIDLETGERRMLDTKDPGDPSQSDGDAVEPAWSPDGSRIAFWSNRDGRRDIFTVSAMGGERIQITSDVHTDWNPMWSPDSRTIYFISDRGGEQGIWSIALDSESGRPVGGATAMMAGPTTVDEAAVSSGTGQIIFSVKQLRSTIERVDFDRELEEITSVPEVIYSTSGAIITADITRDGGWITYRSGAPSEDIYVMRRDGTARRRLTDSLAKDRGPVWTSDGGSIIFYSNRDGTYRIWRMGRDGTDPHVLFESPGGVTYSQPLVSADGRLIGAQIALTGYDSVRLFELGDDGAYLPIETAVSGFSPNSFSPDASMLFGMSVAESGQPYAAICEIGSGEIRALESPEGVRLQPLVGFWSSWITETKIVGWDPVHRRIFVGDAETGTSRWISDRFDGPVEILAPADASELFLIRGQTNVDIWMADLETGGG